MLARVFHRQIDMAEIQEKCDQEREEREKCREECEKHEKRGANQRACINKAFEKIECLDGSNPNRCLPWLEQIHVMSNHYNRDFCEELLLNSGASITKTMHNIDVIAMPNKRYCIVQSFQLKNTFTKTSCFQFYPTETR